jgi:TetR/AcrR family transcriptional repressor of nem operon
LKPKLFNEKDVLRKAMTLFWLHGFDGTSMQMLQDGMNLSRASIYHSFGSKNELFRRALQEYIDEIGNQYQQCLNSYDDVIEAIHALIKKITQTDRHPLGCLLILSTLEISQHEPATQKIIHTAQAHMRNVLANKLKQAGINSSNNKAQILCIIINGLLVMNKAGESLPSDIKKVLEQVCLGSL